jgi:hypothetical protein
MTRDESLQLVEMVLSHWRVRDWNKEEIDAFARGIQDLDAEVVTSAVIRASKELEFAPRLATLREYVRIEKRRLAPVVEPLPERVGRPLPLWVRRWLCARFFYERWGKERDLRRFVEQGDFGDLTLELMPEGAWVTEAESLGEKEFHEAFQKMFRS